MSSEQDFLKELKAFKSRFIKPELDENKEFPFESAAKSSEAKWNEKIRVKIFGDKGVGKSFIFRNIFDKIAPNNRKKINGIYEIEDGGQLDDNFLKSIKNYSFLIYVTHLYDASDQLKIEKIKSHLKDLRQDLIIIHNLKETLSTEDLKYYINGFVGLIDYDQMKGSKPAFVECVSGISHFFILNNKEQQMHNREILDGLTELIKCNTYLISTTESQNEVATHNYRYYITDNKFIIELDLPGIIENLKYFVELKEALVSFKFKGKQSINAVFDNKANDWKEIDIQFHLPYSEAPIIDFKPEELENNRGVKIYEFKILS